MFITRIKSFILCNHIYIDHYDLNCTGISLNEFRQRRYSLVNLIRNDFQTEQKQSSKNFTICFLLSTRQFMGFDVAYFSYKQQSDFYYLTDCMQLDAILLLHDDDQTFSTNLFFKTSIIYENLP